MTRAFYDIAFTPRVLDMQKKQGSDNAYAKFLTPEAPPNDALTEAEAAFIRARDGFYQATVSETGWPYVQYRGGPKGFLHVLNEKNLAYADFRGNRQYLSVGNLGANDRIALFFMDYANRRRLKLLGHARVVEAGDDPDLMERLSFPDYRATPERAVVIEVAAYDWNCPQHITERYTQGEIEEVFAPARERLAQLEAENASLKARLASYGASAPS